MIIICNQFLQNNQKVNVNLWLVRFENFERFKGFPQYRNVAVGWKM